jgi:large subunit ribosomal protein L13
MKAKLQKTTLATSKTVDPKWHTVDAEGQILGRLADKVAVILMGKHKPEYTTHVDTGDFVVITNAEKIRVSGSKAETKEYDSYSYYPGGRKIVSYAKMMEKYPERIISEAVRRMLPKSKLGRSMFSKLKVYAGPDHPHSAQQPQEMKVN